MNLKKFFILLTSSALLLSAVSGCTSSGTASDSTENSSTQAEATELQKETETEPAETEPADTSLPKDSAGFIQFQNALHVCPAQRQHDPCTGNLAQYMILIQFHRFLSSAQLRMVSKLSHAASGSGVQCNSKIGIS